MIIQCSRCGTRYRFPDDKIKPTGSKVRCVRCQNIFRVMPTAVTPESKEKVSSEGAFSAAMNGKSGKGLLQGVPLHGKKQHPVATEEFPSMISAEMDRAKKATAPAASGSGGGEEGLDLSEGPSEESDTKDDLFSKADFFEDEASAVPTADGLTDDGMFTRESSLDMSYSEPARKNRSLLGRLFLLLFFLLVICCSAIAGYFFWRGEPFDMAHLMKIFQPVQNKSREAAGKINLREVNSYYAFNQDAGQLFVLSGTAVNEFSEPRSGISVRGILYDEKGRELLQQTVFCGNPFEKEMLAEMSYNRIEETMNNQFGTTFSNLNIAPGKEIPFSIVFRNLPKNLAEFSVEVVGSRPAAEK